MSVLLPAGLHLGGGGGEGAMLLPPGTSFCPPPQDLAGSLIGILFYYNYDDSGRLAETKQRLE